MAEPQSKTKIIHNNKISFKNLLGRALDFIASKIFVREDGCLYWKVTFVLVQNQPKHLIFFCRYSVFVLHGVGQLYKQLCF